MAGYTDIYRVPLNSKKLPSREDCASHIFRPSDDFIMEIISDYLFAVVFWDRKKTDTFLRFWAIEI